MKTTSLSTLAALASSLQAVAANGWSDAPSFQCPANTDNSCNPQQQTGWDWSTLSTGQQFSSYGGYNFNGWSCQSSFGGSSSKRDLIRRRGFQPKCIVGVASSDASSCPSWSAPSSGEGSEFSVTTVQISVEFDCVLEFQYGMPDGSLCKQRSACSASGSSISNTQCGGAKNVTVVYPSSVPGKSTCSVGVHSVGYDCSTASSTAPITYTATVASTTASSVLATTSASTFATSVLTTSSVAALSTTSSVAIIATSSQIGNLSTTAVIQGTTTTASVVTGTTISASVVTGTTTAVSVVTGTTTAVSVVTGTTTAASVITDTTVLETSTTEVVVTTVTTCPVTSTQVVGGSTTVVTTESVSTVFITSTSTICTRCEASATAATTTIQEGSTTTVTSVSTETITTSSLLPSCLNTWIFITGCGSNTASECWCGQEIFITNVYSCLSAYGADDTEIYEAQLYFQGICVSAIPSNPAIVTCASTFTDVATSTQTVPVATYTYATTIVSPMTVTAGQSQGNTIAGSSTTIVVATTLTVPEVTFSTIESGTSTIAALVPATETAAAITAPAAGGGNTTVPSVTSKTSSSVVTFTGAASKVGASFGGLAAAAVIALL